MVTKLIVSYFFIKSLYLRFYSLCSLKYACFVIFLIIIVESVLFIKKKCRSDWLEGQTKYLGPETFFPKNDIPIKYGTKGCIKKGSLICKDCMVIYSSSSGFSIIRKIDTKWESTQPETYSIFWNKEKNNQFNCIALPTEKTDAKKLISTLNGIKTCKTTATGETGYFSPEIPIKKGTKGRIKTITSNEYEDCEVIYSSSVTGFTIINYTSQGNQTSTRYFISWNLDKSDKYFCIELPSQEGDIDKLIF